MKKYNLFVYSFLFLEKNCIFASKLNKFLFAEKQEFTATIF